jgi:uncharacterized protein YxjI
MQDFDITFGDAKHDNCWLPFERAITKCDAFNFDGSDIVRIRTDLIKLIDRLSIIYKTENIVNVEENITVNDDEDDADDVAEGGALG